MTGQTKMIIITSDEDIIRKFSLNKTKNTQIIDLDNDKQTTSNETNVNNMIHIALLAELSQPNSNNDQVYKRALDSPDSNPPKVAKTSKKSIDRICVICGDRAIGFNYDVLSCISCKAFIRRNAHQNPERLRCLTGQGQCSVAYETHRKCPKCRLQRCFDAGMRKDFVLSEEEKQQGKKRPEETPNLASQGSSTSASVNSSSATQSIPNPEYFPPILDEIDRLLMDVEKVEDDNVLQQDNQSNEIEDILFETLSIEDWITIQSVQSSFISVFHCPTEQFGAYIDFSNRTSALISWSEYVNQLALRFIDFFRQINEFQDLLLDDRLILIKYNLLPVFPICKCHEFKFAVDQCRFDGFEQEMEEHGRFFSFFNASDNIHNAFVEMIFSLLQNTEGNPTVLSLLLIILILTPGLSMNEEEPPLNDSLAVNRVQCYYTKILWNYFVSQFGETEACRRYTQLLNLILRMQSTSKTLRTFFGDQCARSNTVDKIAPLMHSVLNIS